MKDNFIQECSEIMPAVQQAVNAVTTQQLDRFGSKMDEIKPTDKVLGTLHSELARRLYAAYAQMKTKGMEIGLRSKLADNDEQEKEQAGEAKRILALGSIAEEMLWYEVRQSMSCWHGDIGLRKGWAVVLKPEEENDGIPPFIRRIMGGGE